MRPPTAFPFISILELSSLHLASANSTGAPKCPGSPRPGALDPMQYNKNGEKRVDPNDYSFLGTLDPRKQYALVALARHSKEKESEYYYHAHFLVCEITRKTWHWSNLTDQCIMIHVRMKARVENYAVFVKKRLLSKYYSEDDHFMEAARPYWKIVNPHHPITGGCVSELVDILKSVANPNRKGGCFYFVVNILEALRAKGLVDDKVTREAMVFMEKWGDARAIAQKAVPRGKMVV